MNTTVIGILLIVIGLIALTAGIGGGIAQMFIQIKKEVERGQAGLLDLPTKLIDSLVKFMNALAKAPIWLALTILGIFLIAWGGKMLA